MKSGRWLRLSVVIASAWFVGKLGKAAVDADGEAAVEAIQWLVIQPLVYGVMLAMERIEVLDRVVRELIAKHVLRSVEEAEREEKGL